MSPGRLLQYFDQISDAPDAVPRLRRLILDLAVRGKLVEQNPADEPVTELLKRIETEKRQLLTEDEIKRREAPPLVAANELLFGVPSRWSVQRMGWLAKKLGAGSTPLGGKSVYQEEGVPFLRSQNVYDEGIRLEGVALISRSIHEEMSATHVEPQDILLNITGASIGRCALVPSGFREGNVSQHVAIIRLFFSDIREFVHLSLISPPYQKLIRDVEVGVSREGLSMRRFRLFPMILPPIAEQSRIVAKVDELMALCDELEAARAKRERRRDRLVEATLHGLNNGDVSAEPGTRLTFEDSARFYFNHLPRLSTRPEHIQQLRQTILNLAVRGKVVPQDPRDEPATELVKQIEADKAQHAKEGKLPRPSPLTLLNAEDLPCGIPAIWRWCRLAELCLRIQYGYTASANPSLQEVRLLRITDIQDNRVHWESVPGCDISSEQVDQYLLADGDVLIARTGGTIGKSFLVKDIPLRAVFASYLIRIQGSRKLFDRYLKLFLESPVYWEQLTTGARGTGQPNVNGQTLGNMAVPLPPLAEQHRIVAKVDELMALCNDLETRLTTTATTRRELLEATLHEALERGL